MRAPLLLFPALLALLAMPGCGAVVPLAAWPDDAAKRDRCLTSLIEDGLVEPVPVAEGTPTAAEHEQFYRLPTADA